jgi:2-polyprenyl-6-methoxyphenol hydroxylase-like FAD-dependent oxidoreductase
MPASRSTPTVVIGADGLHSTVRRLVLGPESGSTRWLGAHLAVASIPNYRDLRDSMDWVGRSVLRFVPIVN